MLTTSPTHRNMAKPLMMTAAAVLLLSTLGTAAQAADVAGDDDAMPLHCANRTHGCSGHGKCEHGQRCACDNSYEGSHCDVWRSAGGVATSLAGLVDLRWHNCTHDASLTQRCTRENSTVCEHAGAPTVPTPCPEPGQPDQFMYGIPGQTMGEENPYICGSPRCASSPPEFPMVVHGVSGTYCAPECGGADASPNECSHPTKFNNIHAKPMCLLRPCEMEAKRAARTGRVRERVETPGCDFSVCALACDPSIPQDPAPVPPGQPNPNRPNCPTGMTCKPVPDAAFKPPAPPTPPNPLCTTALDAFCGGEKGDKLQCTTCILQHAPQLQQANCSATEEAEFCNPAPVSATAVLFWLAEAPCSPPAAMVSVCGRLCHPAARRLPRS